MGRFPRLEDLVVVFHVHWRLDARLRLFPLLAYFDRQSGLHGRHGAVAQCPAIRLGCDYDYHCVCGCFIIQLIISGWLSDRAGQRGIFVMGFSLLGLVGFVMCIATSSPGVGYAGVCELTTEAFWRRAEDSHRRCGYLSLDSSVSGTCYLSE